MKSDMSDTIAAPATPPGRGGVGIIRISGSKVRDIATALLGKIPPARYATYSGFVDEIGQMIDQGIALYFPAPNSFTGEEVLELHGHGGPVVMDALLQRVLACGARMARPGEFSERAFLNNKIDLAQAEAVADLIDATSLQAAQFAMRSLQGEFSQQIQNLITALIELRMYVEAAIDFPEEEIDFLSDGHVTNRLAAILSQLITVRQAAQQGAILREGLTVVIAGRPNAGKSSLLNRLSGQETAIISDVPGTTRDLLREQIQIDGIPLQIIDTAGLRKSNDQIEQEGMRRALKAIEQADAVLLVVDATNDDISLPDLGFDLPLNKLILVRNKIDLIQEIAGLNQQSNFPVINLSAKTGEGLSLLKQQLKSLMGLTTTTESGFSARRRHLTALEKAKQHLLQGQQQLQNYRAGELLAEELLQAQQALAEITGEFRADDLLGHIFASFCIGK